jgi:hypothetical protein
MKRSQEYRVTAIDGALTLSAEAARAAYDNTPPELRRGRRDGAFMLFDEDDLGRRTPTIYQPVTSSSETTDPEH